MGTTCACHANSVCRHTTCQSKLQTVMHVIDVGIDVFVGVSDVLQLVTDVLSICYR